MILRKELNNISLLTRSWKSIYSSKEKFKRHSSKGSDGISIQDFKDNDRTYLLMLQKELKKNKYHNSALKGIPIKKSEPEKYRLIAVSNIKDRIVHKALLGILNPIVFPFIDNGVSYCGVKKNIWAGSTNEALTTKKAFEKVLEHVRNKKFYVFKADIKGFYDHVPKRMFFNILKKLIPDNSLIPIIKEIIYFKLSNPEEFDGKKASLLPKKYVGISQGSALSQFFANIYLADFDIKMKKKYGDRFIRYVDDFIIFFDTKEEAKKAKKYAIRALKVKKLELSSDPNKTKTISIKNDYVEFLGIRIDQNKLSYKKSRAETQKVIKEILDEHNQDLYRRYKNTADIINSMNNKIKGRGDYLHFYHTEDTYEEINKWIQIKRKQKKFKNLQLLNPKKITPIIKKKNGNHYLNRMIHSYIFLRSC
ncbi:MAG: hypothetical protein KBD46_01665 [Candidatus Levybacteria bacterium]|nr:hypothetical protein [Candidatus Levybacteria bacterium]